MTTLNGNANEVLEIIDDVHRRLGQDLHDGIEQELVGLGLISQALLNRLQNDRNSIPKEKLDSYRELAKKLVEGFTRAQEGIQAISRGLIPTNGFHEDLTQALDETCTEFHALQDAKQKCSNSLPMSPCKCIALPKRPSAMR